MATLAVYLNSLTGKGVHLVTVNDYLARRDARWMGAIYHFLGLSVGSLQMAAATENGKKAFVAHGCWQCHGFEGQGSIATSNGLTLNDHEMAVTTGNAYTAALTLDGWLRTGDLGRLDTDGFLTLIGRSKNVIIGPSGENIYPEEIERALADLAPVRDAAAVGLEHPERGELLVAFVVLCLFIFTGSAILRFLGILPGSFSIRS